ncbi:hypothetical protein LWI29_033263 [Acer saccharum]|uniref:Uncharacterized protein n=1 Tax=Acer saccharum TaxID=4024 RepID=A0AA39RFI2_ACESA|nr:hypothetical protein LWI29_033263 [Acer saccharum]
MVGGGSRKDESLVINSTNVFAALGSLKKKKKSTGKEQGSSKSKTKDADKEKEKEVSGPRRRLPSSHGLTSTTRMTMITMPLLLRLRLIGPPLWTPIPRTRPSRLLLRKLKVRKKALMKLMMMLRKIMKLNLRQVEVESITKKPPETPLAPKDAEAALKERIEEKRS